MTSSGLLIVISLFFYGYLVSPMKLEISQDSGGIKQLWEEIQRIEDNQARQYDTALHGAAALGYMALAKNYVNQEGANVNGKDSNHNTPLHLAAQYNNFDVAKYLVEKGAGASIDETNYDDLTPLQLAAQSGSLRVVEYLLEQGANVNVGEDVGTPLYLAAVAKPPDCHLDVVEYLVYAGADLSLMNPDDEDTIVLCKDVEAFLLEKGANV